MGTDGMRALASGVQRAAEYAAQVNVWCVGQKRKNMMAFQKFAIVFYDYFMLDQPENSKMWGRLSFRKY